MKTKSSENESKFPSLSSAEFDHYEFNSGNDDERSGHPFSSQMEELCALYHNELERVSPSYEV